jgi:putative cardiolipin synthase
MGLRWRARWREAATATLVLALLAGCTARPELRRHIPDYTSAPRTDGLFADVEARIARDHGPDRSGFTLLERNEDALRWRLALIDSARHSLDLQYYVWFGDAAGTLLMLRVIDAADRGVKVRILFDDLNTMLHDMGHVELRDAIMASIDAHPNIEIRVFNPWQDRSVLGRAFDLAADFGRLNRRMHNKQMIADNRAAIIGGRNLADEYFGLNPKFNFHDLDTLGVGPVARQASAVFDRYWNSPWAQRVPGTKPASADGLAKDARSAALAQVVSHPSLRHTAERLGDWSAEIGALPAQLAAGRSAVHTDAPSRDLATQNHVPEAFRALMRSAQRELLITNAYIIPDPHLLNDLAELTARGVTVHILTNSLSSHDVPAVNSHYQQWREPILGTGASLYELRADAALRAQVVEIAPNKAEFVGLHTKAMVIDRTRAFVGSMNLDPRSEIHNSEMGVVIDSPALAEILASRMERDMNGANSWRVVINPDGDLRWRSDAGELDRQPARNALQWIEDFIFKFFPADLY